MSRCVLYRVLDWGLGHATRSLPVIRHLIDRGYGITVSSSGRALRLLQAELRGSREYHEFPGLDSSWGRDHRWVFLLPKAPSQIVALLRAVKLEHRAVEEEVRRRKCDLVISDHCYGARCRGVPSSSSATS